MHKFVLIAAPLVIALTTMVLIPSGSTIAANTEITAPSINPDGTIVTAVITIIKVKQTKMSDETFRTLLTGSYDRVSKPHVNDRLLYDGGLIAYDDVTLVWGPFI